MDKFERFYFAGSNSQLSGVDFGNPDKPDLVMLHGMRDHGLSMLSLAQALRSDYHVINVDLCGHGQSDNPGTYTMTQFVADLRSLILTKSLVKPVLVGHSLGGHIVAKYAAIYADEVSKLVLLDGMGPPGMEQEPSREQLLDGLRSGIDIVLAGANNGRKMVDASEALSRLQRNNPLLSIATAQLIVEHGIQEHPQGGVRWCWDPAVQMVWQTFSNNEAETLWSLIECPTLIVTGDQSLRYWSAMRQELLGQEDFYAAELLRRQQIFKDARHHVIAGAGHMLHYDQPDSVNELLVDFLS